MLNPIIGTLRMQLLTRAPLDAMPEGVWKRTGALNTWGTNAIEGNALSWADVEKLLLEGRSVADRPMRDVLETIQHEAAFRSLLRRRAEPVRLATVLELHEEVFKGIKPDAGQWRRVNIRIVGARFTPPRMEKVVPLMTEWEEEYARRDTRGEDVFTLGAWMHHRFEMVHPFSDGNGRAGRLLLNLHFLKHDWPAVHVLPPDRLRYLKCLDSGQSGDLGPLEDFLRVAMGRSLLDLLDQVGTKDDSLLPLKALARRGPYSAKYIALRLAQGHLSGLKIAGDWHTSPRALQAYRTAVGKA